MEYHEYQYVKLANDLEGKVRSGSYKAGEKLPSLRAMRRQTGHSISTIYHAYTELEQRGIVNVREKSGFFVQPLIDRSLPLSAGDKKIIHPHKVAINAMATMLQRAVANPNMLAFGTALAGSALLPKKQLAREVRRAAEKYASGELIGYCHPTGHKPLCTEIEKRMVGCFNSAHGDEVVITGGCMAAIDLCLRTVAKAGDIILVESPTFLCYLQLIEDLNMRALELPVDPDTGIDLELLQRALGEHDVRAALLNTNFHNPLGYVMELGPKREIVDIFTRKMIPIIEDDIYGDLYFGETRPMPLKFYDREGMVLYCSSFTKTLAPDLRIGWIVPGRYREKIKRVKFNSSVASQQLMQDAVAGFLARGAYERHLRKMRNALKKQLADFLRAIVEYFPENTRVSAPKGGLCLWVELDNRIDGMELFEQAKGKNISIVPGSLCSATKNFRHCIRLNFGSPWTEKSEKGVQTLGEIISELIKEKRDNDLRAIA
jgi:DNA-binding transcriptional MocR family regulator